MKYVLLSALLALGGTEKVSSQLVEWCRGIDPVQIEEVRSYSRTIRIEQKEITVIYEDRGDRGRDKADILKIEGERTLFIDETLDGIIDGGEIEGVFFRKEMPSYYLTKGQEMYTKLLKEITSKIKKNDEKGLEKRIKKINSEE
ncbi:hypothetical protein HYU21_04525 [Candidatus Woesearchaeota archaeon]|nr:hypothetical protein [Candidatus Woesearchaeota archaeon]